MRGRFTAYGGLGDPLGFPAGRSRVTKRPPACSEQRVICFFEVGCDGVSYLPVFVPCFWTALLLVATIQTMLFSDLSPDLSCDPRFGWDCA